LLLIPVNYSRSL